MNNFTYYNPTKIVFGKGTISKLPGLVRKDRKIMMTYGGGSIKKNGVYDQVMEALQGYDIIEFGGIPPNPEYEILLKAAEAARKENVDFLLSVGGGSVLDGTKFIAAVIKYSGQDPWEDIMKRHTPIEEAVPLGSVLTLPATGSEMNPNLVISRAETKEKLALGNPLLYPVLCLTYRLDR